MDVQTDVGHINLIGGLVTRNLPKNEILDELVVVYLSINPNYCIIGGDFNVNFSRPGICQEYIKTL